MTRYFPASKVSLFDFSCVGEDPTLLPCAREWVVGELNSKEFDDTGWQCTNDHTGCIFNDGHNMCSHRGNSTSPLEEKSND